MSVKKQMTFIDNFEKTLDEVLTSEGKSEQCKELFEADETTPLLHSPRS